MIKSFVKRPAMTVVFVSFFIILGLVSYFNINIELAPQIEFPIVTVTTTYPGATPFEVESEVVKKIEEEVREISEIKKIKSSSYESLGYVFIEFNLGVDVNAKLVEVKDKVESIVNDLPDNADKPIAEKFDPLAIPVVEMILNSDSHDEKELYEYADKKLKSRLSSIEGVASVEVYGGKERQINVKIDPELAKKYFISISDVIKGMSARNMNLPGGLIEKTDVSVNVRFEGEFMNVEEMSNMELVSRDGEKLLLKDIATVEDSYKRVESMARFNSKNVVGLSVNKANDGNTVKIAANIKKDLPKIQASLPEGMLLSIASDSSEFIWNETNETLLNILLGIILTVLVLYLFTGKFGVTFVATIVIPSSIISALFLVDLSGFSINFMTLLAIGSGLGTLIANAIVVIENILAHLESGKDRISAAIDGTKESTVAVLAAAGTNLVVFTPMVFVGGIAGPFLRQFGLTVVYATIFSIMASFSLTPMLSALILRTSGNNSNGKAKRPNPFIRFANWGMNFLLKEYRYLFDLQFKFPKLSIVVILLAILSSFYLAGFLGSNFVPPSDEDRVRVKITMPQGSTIGRTLKVVKKVEEEIAKYPEVKSYLSNLGENGVENASVNATLFRSTKRDKSDMDIINELLPKFAAIPDAEIELKRGGEMGGDEADVTTNIYGKDYDKMIEYSSKALNIMRESGYFRSVVSSFKKPKNELVFVPNQELMTRYGITYQDVATVLRASIYGDDTNQYKESGEEYDINIEIDEAYINSFEDIKEINIITEKGLIPITALGDVKKSKAIPPILRRDGERIIKLDGYLSKSSAGIVQGILDKSFKEIKFEDGYGYRYAGDAENQEESTRELLKTFILAAILTYMILVAILNSFLHPFTIATTIITSFSGVFVTLFFLDFTINVGSMLAIVMLVGLVVNNAILILDSTLARLGEGYPIVDSIWFGIRVKFRAVLMTSIAIIFGALPQIQSTMEIKASIGAVIIGGMLGSIVFTFLLIPLVFWYLERMKRFFFKEKVMAG